ncbi:MAG: hypothetical protein HXY30_09190 [Pseudorhodoplanes sp.]|nr:hypothetical protein [Pseudorhodoplanes sp.]
MARQRPIRIPYDELGVQMTFRRRHKPDVARQRKRYWKILESLRRKER